MPITVEVPDVGEVEFPDEMKPDEIKSVLSKRFGPKETAGMVPSLARGFAAGANKEAGALLMGAGAATAPRVQRTAPDVGGFEDTERPSFLPSVASEMIETPAEQAAAANEAGRSFGAGSRRMTMPELAKTPIFGAGKYIRETGEQIPVPKNLAGRVGESVGGMLPVVMTGPAAPATIALSDFGSTLDEQYQANKKKGASDEQALADAMATAKDSGMMTGAVWTVLPKPLQSLLGRLTGKIGGNAVKDFIARRIVKTGEMSALGGASQAARNLATGRPAGENVVPALEGGALVGAFTPGERREQPPIPDLTAKAAEVLPIAAREAAKEPTSNNQQPTESETPNAGELIFDSSEHKANWEAVQKAQADYDSTQPHTPERAAARKSLNEAKDKPGAQKTPINPKDPLRAVPAYANSDLSIGAQQDLTGAAWDGKADANGVRRIRLKDGAYVWLKESDAHPLIKEALDNNTKSTTEVQNASKNKTSNEVHANVRAQSGEGEGQVPAEEGGGGVQPPAEGEKGNLPLSNVHQEIQQLSELPVDEFGKRVATKTGDTMNDAHRLGMAVSMPEEVAALREAEAKTKTEAAALKKAGDFKGAIAVQIKGQYFREAREYATETGSVQRLMAGNPEYKPKMSGSKQAEKNTGWMRAPEVSYGGMKAEGLSEDQKAQLEPTWEFTDKRKGSPTEGTTVYVPEGSDAETIQKAIMEKAKAVESAKGGENIEKEKGQKEGVLTPEAQPAMKNVSQLADGLKSNPKLRTQYGAHIDVRPDAEQRVESIKKKGLSSGFLNDITEEGKLGWAESTMSGPRGLKKGDVVYLVKNKGLKVKPGTRPEAVVRITRDGQTLFEAMKEQSPVAPGDIKARAKQFDALLMENAERAGWSLRPDDLHTEVGDMKAQSGTAAIKGKIARDKELARVRRTLAKRLGLDPDKMGDAKYRAANLDKLQQHVEELNAKAEAAQSDVGDESEFTQADVEQGFNPEEPPAKGPKLAPEANQGDLVDATQKDTLSLSGEEEKDAVKAAAEKAQAEKDAAEAKALEEKQQGNLFPVGPGAQTRPGARVPQGGEVLESNIPPLEQLAQVVKSFPKQKGSFKADLEQWLTDIGIPIKDRLARTYAALKAVPGWIAAKANTLPEVGDLDRRVGQWNAQDWTGGEAARAFGGAIKNTFKDRSKLRALSNYINAGGDKDLLARQAQLTKSPALRKTYEDALTFGEDEEHLAKAIKFYHDQMLEWGRREGALEEGLDNYLHRYYRSDDPVLQKKLQALEYLKFSKDFAGFKKRYYDSDFEAEQVGLTPEKDAAKRILAYDYGFRQALVAREFVKNSFNAKQAVAKDGRPELDVAGGGTQVAPGEEGGKGVTLIKPKWRQDTGDPKDYRGDYVSFEHPAFKKWKWATQDSDGKPILVQGDILVHPDFAKKYEALFERSWWGKGPVRRALRGGSGFVKQTMLLGPFHLFQITTGGVEHRINPFKLLELNTSDPAQQRMAEAGLFAEAGPYATEGVGGGGLLDKIPVAGQYFQAAKDWLFKDYIPRWKMTLALKAEERNMQRYAPNIAKGEVTPEQITRMSARQAAAVFGGQNQRAIFRSKTFQDNFRMLFLAPDFGEERLRQVLQAGGKYGHEQRAALVLGGVAMMVLAKSIEQALTGEMHWKRPFTVTYNGKEYGMRNPASDIGHLISDPVGYLRNRLNPVYTRPLLELMTGRDSFGRKRSAGQQLSDEIKQVIPIPARGLAEKNQSVWESLLNSTGITEHRRSAFGDVMKSINDWKEKKGYNAAAEFVYDSDKDPYYPLTQALSSNDAKGAQSQLDKLTSGKSAAERGKVYQHYLKSLVQHRYLTGSRAHETEFLKEAGAADRQAYDDAKKERMKMWQTFRQAWEKRKQ